MYVNKHFKTFVDILTIIYGLFRLPVPCLGKVNYPSPWRLYGPKVGNSIKCFSQGHSDALPHRESNQGFVTFQLLARCSTN